MAHGTCEADVPLSRCKQSCEVMLLYGNVQASLSPFNFKQHFFFSAWRCQTNSLDIISCRFCSLASDGKYLLLSS